MVLRGRDYDGADGLQSQQCPYLRDFALITDKILVRDRSCNKTKVADWDKRVWLLVGAERQRHSCSAKYGLEQLLRPHVYTETNCQTHVRQKMQQSVAGQRRYGNGD